jgi:hypothetical protein
MDYWICVWLGLIDTVVVVVVVAAVAVVVVAAAVQAKIKKSIPLESPAAALLVVENTVWAGTFQRIELFCAKDYSNLMSLEGHTGMIHDMILVQHTDTVWSCSSDKEIRAWSTQVRCSSFDTHARW